MGRKLARNVVVDGMSWSAGDTPPDEIAELITNPLAWGDPAPKHSDPKRQALVDRVAETSAQRRATAETDSIADLLEGESASTVAALVADRDDVEFANAVLEWEIENKGTARKAVAAAVHDVIGD